jgi:hypothetical protein
MFSWDAQNAMSPQHAEFNMWKDTGLRRKDRKGREGKKEKKDEENEK